MAGKQAKILSARHLSRALQRLRQRDSFERERVILLLSIRAGLRACEIARLRWDMVLDAHGRVSTTLDIRDAIAKRGSGRRIPLHRDLRDALICLRRSRLRQSAYVITSVRGGSMRANSIVNWFVRLYREIGATGCSSHSGRRTFITTAAHRAHRAANGWA
jgi:integrase